MIAQESWEILFDLEQVDLVILLYNLQHKIELVIIF